ncbi:MAG: hypothetical protein K2H33_02085 [Muribaculaceae bacterium]|nr:hypothetical protein [Muribaculaceae bacterium]
MKPYLKYIVGAMLFAAFFCCYYFVAPHILYFQEQHHLFLWSADYWRNMAHLRGPLYPLMAFVVQFCYYPALGAAVWSLLLVLVYFMLQSVVYRLSGYRDLFQITTLVPVYLCSSMLTIDAYPMEPVRWFVWIFAIWALAMIFGGRRLPWVRRRMESREPGRRCWAWLSPLLAVVCLGAGYQAFVKERVAGPIHEAERTMIETEQSVRARRWADVLERTDAWAATGHKNHLMSYFRALALYHTGGLFDHLLDYPQTFGIRSLFFPWRGDKNQAEYGHYVYQDLGHINEAHRWVFEAMVGWGETAPLLNYMVEYNIAMGRPVVADKFLCKLEQSTFYGRRAEFLRGCLADGKVPGLRYAMEGVSPDPVRWNNVINIGGETKFILLKDPENEMARQYLLMSMLLVGNGDAAVRTLIEHYPVAENRVLPRLVQEALVMYRMSMGMDAINSLGYEISPEVENRFREYMVENAKGANARFNIGQRRSYWYYVQHILPRVNHDFSRKQAQSQS